MPPRAKLKAPASAAPASGATLEELDLTNTTLGEEGGGALRRLLDGSAALRGSLHTLKLEDCSLEEDGCRPVCEAVAGLPQLRLLDLRFNDMEAPSAAALGASLSGKAALEKVLLDEEREWTQPTRRPAAPFTRGGPQESLEK